MFARSSLLVVIATSLVFIAAIGSTAARAQSGGAPQPPAQRPRIGVYESRAVALAWGRSAATLAQRKAAYDDLQKQLKVAESARDTQKMDQIKARGSNMQTVAHMQVFSNAPADEALAAIQDKLPAIAKEAGVSIITARLDFQGDNVEVVDVTDKLVAEFKPDQRTLTMIGQVRQQKPISLLEALSIKE